MACNASVHAVADTGRLSVALPRWCKTDYELQSASASRGCAKRALMHAVVAVYMRATQEKPWANNYPVPKVASWRFDATDAFHACPAAEFSTCMTFANREPCCEPGTSCLPACCYAGGMEIDGSLVLVSKRMLQVCLL
jgi:hypothetical protein